MTQRIVFVTQELDPIAPGGAGAVIAGMATRLSERHQVTVLLGAHSIVSSAPADFAIATVTRAQWTARLSGSDRSRLALELATICRDAKVDMVEFTDFEALGFWALSHREELDLAHVRIAVRLHGPVEAVAAAVGSAPPLFNVLGGLVRLTLSMADMVLVPSAEVGRWAADRYRLDADRVVVAPPPVPEVHRRRWAPSPDPSFAFYGRLAEQKGVHDLVQALPPVLDSHPSLVVTVIGPDGWSLRENRPMSEVVTDLIPQRHRHRIELVGAMSREGALDRLASAWAVVVPSRFETFCLAAHEVRRAGIPVIAPELPAFERYRIGAGFLLYDGSISGLSHTLNAVAADRRIVERLAAEPAPVVGDPSAAYDRELPDPRHPRSQAGLATAAVHHAEEMLRPVPRRGSGAARRLLRTLPGPVARRVVRLVPPRIKDPLRLLAPWPAAEGRARRRSCTELRVRSGEFRNARSRSDGGDPASSMNGLDAFGVSSARP